jgi:hypothetical protein
MKLGIKTLFIMIVFILAQLIETSNRLHSKQVIIDTVNGNIKNIWDKVMEISEDKISLLHFILGLISEWYEGANVLYEGLTEGDAMQTYESCKDFRENFIKNEETEEKESEEAKSIGIQLDTLEDNPDILKEECHIHKKLCKENAEVKDSPKNYKMKLFIYTILRMSYGDKFVPRNEDVREKVIKKFGSLENYVLFCQKNEDIDCDTLVNKKISKEDKLKQHEYITKFIEYIYDYKDKFDSAKGCMEGIFNLAKKIYNGFGGNSKQMIKEVIERAATIVSGGVLNALKGAFYVYSLIIKISDVLGRLNETLNVNAKVDEFLGSLPFSIGQLFGLGIRMGVSMITTRKRIKKI